MNIFFWLAEARVQWHARTIAIPGPDTSKQPTINITHNYYFITHITDIADPSTKRREPKHIYE